IEEQFPEFKPANVCALGEGWDNTVLLVNGNAVFRFPRRAIAVPLLEREMAVLPQLALRVPVRVPNPEWRGAPPGRYPRCFAGYRRLEGIDASTGVTEEQRLALARPLAEIPSAATRDSSG